MRKLNFLKFIIDLAFIFGCLGLAVVFGLLISAAFSSELLFDFRIEETMLTFKSKFFWAITALSVVKYSLSLTALYFFRVALENFRLLKIFSQAVIDSFRKMGYLLILGCFLGWIASFLVNLGVKNQFSINFELNTNVLYLCVGLFFLVLAEIFTIAKLHNDELKMTV